MEEKSLRQVLEETGAAVIQTVGISMKPMLRARESTVLVQKIDGPCRKNDVVLYIRPDGQYALHRLVQVGKRWLVQGDYQLTKEEIKKSWVIGVMAGYHRRLNSPYCSVHTARYQLYVKILPLLRLWLRLRGWAGKAVKGKKEKHEVRKA